MMSWPSFLASDMPAISCCTLASWARSMLSVVASGPPILGCSGIDVGDDPGVFGVDGPMLPLAGLPQLESASKIQHIIVAKTAYRLVTLRYDLRICIPWPPSRCIR